MIFSLSAETAPESSETSGRFLEWIFKNLYRDFEWLSEAEQLRYYEAASFWVRKCAHMCIYAVLGVLAFLNVASLRKLRLTVRLIFAWVFCVSYSFADEWHQTFVSGRSGELRDVLIDSIGALIGILFCLSFVRIFSGLYAKVSFNKGDEMSNSEERSRRRMSKDDLLQRNFELSEELHRLHAENERLVFELEEQKKITAALKEEISAAKTRDENVTESSLNEAGDIPPCKPACPEIRLAPDPEYGAKVIGRIVRLAAEYSNRLSGGGELRYKELINLILGHTEVEKANILDIVLSQASSEDKRRMIDSCESSAKEYFESVMAQKT